MSIIFCLLFISYEPSCSPFHWLSVAFLIWKKLKIDGVLQKSKYEPLKKTPCIQKSKVPREKNLKFLNHKKLKNRENFTIKNMKAPEDFDCPFFDFSNLCYQLYCVGVLDFWKNASFPVYLGFAILLGYFRQLVRTLFLFSFPYITYNTS